MASIRIEDKDTAHLHINRMKDAVNDMKGQTAALFQQIEAVGNEISPGLQGFVPKLKEIIPLMDDTVETVDAVRREFDVLIEKQETINTISTVNLD